MKTPPELMQRVGNSVKDLNEKIEKYKSFEDPTHHDLCDLNETVQKNFTVIRNAVTDINSSLNLEILPIPYLSDLGIVYRLIRKDVQVFRETPLPADVLINNNDLVNEVVKLIDQMIEEITNQVVKKCK